MAMRDEMRRDEITRREEEEARHVRRDDDEPEREGDVLGISDAKPNVGEPRRARSGGRRPSGIEVRDRATGIGDVPQRDGASGVDMGAGGEGTDVRPESPRRRVEPDVDE
jgi:hypothetical protein